MKKYERMRRMRELELTLARLEAEKLEPPTDQTSWSVDPILLAILFSTALVTFMLYMNREPWELFLDPQQPYWEAQSEVAIYRLYPISSDTLSHWYRNQTYPVPSRLAVGGKNEWMLVAVRRDSVRYGGDHPYWERFPVAILQCGGRTKVDSTYFFKITKYGNQPPHIRPIIREVKIVNRAE